MRLPLLLLATAVGMLDMVASAPCHADGICSASQLAPRSDAHAHTIDMPLYKHKSKEHELQPRDLFEELKPLPLSAFIKHKFKEFKSYVTPKRRPPWSNSPWDKRAAPLQHLSKRSDEFEYDTSPVEEALVKRDAAPILNLMLFMRDWKRLAAENQQSHRMAPRDAAAPSTSPEFAPTQRQQ